MIKSSIQTIISLHGGEIEIIKNYGNENQSTRKVKGVKNRTKDTKRDVFQFVDQLDIEAGDVLKEKGSRDLWQVSEVEDKTWQGTFQALYVYVRKLGSAASPFQATKASHIQVNAPIYGNVQINSDNSNQSQQGTMPAELLSLFGQAKTIVDQSELSELIKREIQEHLEKIQQLSQTSESEKPAALEIIGKRLEFTKKFIENSAYLTKELLPILTLIGKQIGL